MIGFYFALVDKPSDKELFKEIFRYSSKLMYRTAYSVLKNSALAEEAVQESLLTIAAHIGDFSDHDSNHTAALITIIVRNKAISLQRKENSERGRNTVNYDEENVNISVSDEISLKENYEAVLSAIRSLDVIYSDALLLKYVYGYDSKTISEIYGVSVRTVDSRIYRGKKLLSEKMEGCYGLQKDAE